MNLPLPVVAAVGATAIRALGGSWRVRVEGAEALSRARAASPRVIFAFWHGRLLALTFFHRNQGAHVLASEHRDGEMLGQTIRRLGYGHVRGSSTRGGTRAILELAAALRAGHDLGLTVDGPRGPRHVVKPGVIEVARRTGAAIVPATSASRRHRVLASWDRFELPYPFTRVLVRYGEPVLVPGDADRAEMERRRLELEAALNRITAEADHAISS
jgi:hypothetical protein